MAVPGEARQKKPKPPVPPKTPFQCFKEAVSKHKGDIALDVLGLAAVALDAPVAGTLLGIIAIGNAAANRDLFAGSDAYAGHLGSAAESQLRGRAKTLGGAVGRWALGISAAYDAKKIFDDYKKCMAGS